MYSLFINSFMNSKPLNCFVSSIFWVNTVNSAQVESVGTEEIASTYRENSTYEGLKTIENKKKTWIDLRGFDLGDYST